MVTWRAGSPEQLVVNTSEHVQIPESTKLLAAIVTATLIELDKLYADNPLSQVFIDRFEQWMKSSEAKSFSAFDQQAVRSGMYDLYKYIQETHPNP